MTKAELRNQYIAEGWTVEAVTEWTLVSNVEGVVKYDVKVITPANVFATAQVMVTDDGGVGEEATPLGVLEDQPPGFRDRLDDYVRSQEVALDATVFAVVVTQVYAADAVAEVLAYMDDGTTNRYAVKERAGTFSIQQLA